MLLGKIEAMTGKNINIKFKVGGCSGNGAGSCKGAQKLISKFHCTLRKLNSAPNNVAGTQIKGYNIVLLHFQYMILCLKAQSSCVQYFWG